jgi:hypothetical protein
MAKSRLDAVGHRRNLIEIDDAHYPPSLPLRVQGCSRPCLDAGVAELVQLLGCAKNFTRQRTRTRPILSQRPSITGKKTSSGAEHWCYVRHGSLANNNHLSPPRSRGNEKWLITSVAISPPKMASTEYFPRPLSYHHVNDIRNQLRLPTDNKSTLHIAPI